MRWVLGILSVLVGLAITLPLLTRVAELTTGQGDGPISELAGAVAGIRAAGESGEERETPPQTATVYRWRDAAGTLHYESEPPPAGINSDRLIFKRATRESDGSEPGTAVPRAGGGGIAANPLSVYSRSGQAELMRRLDTTVEQVDRRKELLDRLRQDF